MALDRDAQHVVEPAIRRCLTALGAEGELYDCYLLRCPVNTYVPRHRDSGFLGAKHARLNAIVSMSGMGGELVIDGAEPLDLCDGDAVAFRPDLYMHSVTTVQGSERLVLSVGVLLP